jgi:hypothetical protein
MTTRNRSIYPATIQLEARRRALLHELARREANARSRAAGRRRLLALFTR